MVRQGGPSASPDDCVDSNKILMKLTISPEITLSVSHGLLGYQ
jgi:hypothetical protein